MTGADNKVVLLARVDDAAYCVGKVLGDDDVIAALPAKARSWEWREDLVRRVALRQAWIFACLSGSILAGLYIGAPCDGGGLFAHQFILPDFRRHSVGFARLAAREAFAMFPDVRHLVGLTPVDRRAAVLVALRAGFVKCGVWPCWFDGVDCHCMILRREAFHGIV